MSEMLSAQSSQKLECQGDSPMPLPCGHSLALHLSQWHLRDFEFSCTFSICGWRKHVSSELL